MVTLKSASIFLWILCLVLITAIGISTVTNVTYVDTTTLADINETDGYNNTTNYNVSKDYMIDTGRVKIDISKSYEIDIYIESKNVNVKMNNLNGNNSNVSIESEYIDSKMGSTSQVGFCVTGLSNTNNKPSKFSVDNETVTMNISADYESSDTARLPVQDIVDNCRSK